MAAFDATLSGANATSYVSLERARDLVLDTPQQALWESMSDPEKRSALNAGTFWLETLTYYGSRCGVPSVDDPTKPQALQWPRTGVRKPDTYVNTYATGFPFRISEDYFTDTEIPDQVKRAQVELAVYLHNNVEGISLSGLEDFKSVKVGSIEVTPDKSGAVGADRVPPMFERYLTGLRISGPGNIAIRRS